MSALAQAAATVLAADGRFATVTGRTWNAVGPLVDEAALHVVAPGPTTRFGVTAGLTLGGYRSVTVVDEYPAGLDAAPDALAFTTSITCATDALAAGWSVVQPATEVDVGPLLEAASGPALVLLRDEPAPALADPPDPRRTRLWFDGDMATLIGAGAAVAPMLGLAERLRARGVEAAAVEVAILSSPAQAPLIGGGALLVAGRDTSAAFRNATWPDTPVTAVALQGTEEADLIGTVLSVLSARS
jgi:hypothetical protein